MPSERDTREVALEELNYVEILVNTGVMGPAQAAKVGASAARGIIAALLTINDTLYDILEELRNAE